MEFTPIINEMFSEIDYFESNQKSGTISKKTTVTPEDDFFNILHEDGFTIAGIVVDINPITEDKTGLLAEYLESTEQYLKEKAQERK